MQNPSSEIIQKLDLFIRKYYLNRLIRGAIYSVALLLALFLLMAVLEYFGRFTSTVRFLLVSGYLIGAIAVLVVWVIIPILKIKKLGKVISYEEAAIIVGLHFKPIQDKILNVLQLTNELSKQAENQLIYAAIHQKTLELKPFNFGMAVNLAENKRYAKYALIPLLVILLTLIIYPNLITQSTTRLINYKNEYIPQAPFNFNLKQTNLTIQQHDDFTLELEIHGEQIPAEVYINYNGFEYKMQTVKHGAFTYTFNNVQKNIDFNFFAAGFYSELYHLKVLPKPLITDLQIELNYPPYTQKTNEVIQNTGDLNVPAGTIIHWKLKTENIEQLIFVDLQQKNDSVISFIQQSPKEFSLKKKVFKNITYTLQSKPQNKNQATYQINVIPDAYPEIWVQVSKDSLSNKRYYFTGQIKDDYGFTRLTFNYKINKSDSGSSSSKYIVQNLPINKDVFQTNFFHYWDLSSVPLKPEDQIDYYFEVFDNDGVNGVKSTKSQIFQYKVPSLSELSRQQTEANNQIKKELTQAIEQAKQIQKQIKNLSKELNDKKQLGWEEKKKIEDLVKEQKQLQNKIENLAKLNEQQNSLNNEFNEPTSEILEKQKQLEELFEKVMTDDMKKMFEELQQLLEKLEKTQVQDVLDKMKLDNKELLKELDKNLELFKQLEFEQKLTQISEGLKDLAQKQEELSKQTQNEKNQSDEKQKELIEKQEKLNKEYEQIKEQYKELQEKNKELENQHDLKDFNAKQQEIENELQKSSNELKEKQNKKAAQSQKQAAQKMQDLANEMQKMQEEMQEEEEAEDYQTLRQILENLLQLSFNQEKLIEEVKTIDANNPKFLKIGQAQRKLKDDTKIIEDSLLALSKRNPKISPIVNKEIGAIYYNIEKALEHLQERQLPQAASRQQFAMTSINNLALILSESLQDMQQEMQQKQQQKNSKGGSSCKKPGKGDKPSMQSLRQMQQQLNEQLKKLQQGMQNQGNKPQQGNNSMSKEFAQMAAQQEALRRALQKAMQEGNYGKEGGTKDGGENQNAKELRELAKKMEQTEQDLVNKQLTPETLKRQQDILTRLLEAEKAEREREQDEKRKSNEAKQQEYVNTGKFLEYQKLKKQETELLKTVSPALSPFYKEKVNEYFNSINGAK